MNNEKASMAEAVERLVGKGEGYCYSYAGGSSDTARDSATTLPKLEKWIAGHGDLRIYLDHSTMLWEARWFLPAPARMVAFENSYEHIARCLAALAAVEALEAKK